MSASKKVLVVDDDPHIIEVLSFMLTRSNYDVSSAMSIKRAENILKLEDIDILLTDLSMPDTSGIDFIKSVRSRERARYLPIVVLTAMGLSNYRKQALACGADYFLTKPLSSIELNRIMSSCVEKL